MDDTSTFGPLSQANTRVSCSDGSEVIEFYRFIYGLERPIDIRSNDVETSLALSTFELLNAIVVSTETSETSELEWAIIFLYDVVHVGSLSVDTKNLRCQSEEPVVDSMPAELWLTGNIYRRDAVWKC